MSLQKIGKYAIVREVGRGNMGVVYEARDTQTGRTVAVKLLSTASLPSGADRRQLVERFYREAKAAGSLVHPNIAQVYEAGAENGQHYLVMEFCSGTTLRNVLKFEQRVGEDRLRDYAEQLLGALEVAHAAGIIHRDIKPDNIIIGQNSRLKLMDFGIAKIVSSATMTVAGEVMGSPAYMSPEQVLGKPIDARSDLFSVGVVLYECITGRKPFDGDSITAITHLIAYSQPDPIVGAPDYWQGIISKALAKDPNDRYKTAADMLSDIRNRRAPAVAPRPPVQTTNANVGSQTTFAPPPPIPPYQPPVPQHTPPSQLPPPIPPGYYGPPRPVASDSSLGTIGIVLGIIGFFFGGFAIAGLICGVVASQRNDPRGGTAVGISVVALVIHFIALIAAIAAPG